MLHRKKVLAAAVLGTLALHRAPPRAGSSVGIGDDTVGRDRGSSRARGEVAKPVNEEGAVIALVAGIAGLLVVAAAALVVSRRLRVPFTVLLVVVGIALRQILDRGPELLSDALAWLGLGEAASAAAGHAFEEFAHALDLDVSPDVILFVFVPTLIYESALHLDIRQLRRNLLPVLTLAVPGLLLSTTIIGVVVWLASPFDFVSSLLLGSILSATDPVAVISLFRQLRAPARLTVLVEGESLFNDATAIVLSRILVSVLALGHFSGGVALEGTVQFLFVFLGGALAGWAMALGIGWILGKAQTC